MRSHKVVTWLVVFVVLLGMVSATTAAPAPPEPAGETLDEVTAAGQSPAPQSPGEPAAAPHPAAVAPEAVLHFWDFEANDGGFTASLDWEWGAYAWVGTGCYNANNVPPPNAYSGTGMWGTVLNTCYSDLGNNSGYDTCVNGATADDSILSFTVDLSGVTPPVELSWWEWYDLFMDWDWAEVYANGDVVFQHCGGGHIPPTGWQQQVVDLTPYAGGPVTVEFHMMASTVVNYAGWYIDDVMVTAVTPPDVWKQARPAAEHGEVLSYTITISTTNLTPGMLLTDVLPAGVEYAGNLAWNQGHAWYSDTLNAVLWEYPGPAAGAAAALSQVGPEVGRSEMEDGGSTVLGGAPVGVMGPQSPEAYAWTVVSTPTLGCSRPAGAVDADGYFNIIGGESSGGVRLGQVQRYDPDTGVWDNTLATMPTPASNLCAAVIGDDVYIPGGWTGTTALTTTQVYHIGSNSWETITTDPLPAGRSGPACAAYDGKVYVFGGTDGASYHATAWVYDPVAAAGSRWTALADVPQVGAYGSALAVGDLIFYAGMRDAATSDYANVYAYDPAANSWTAYPSLTTARGAAGMWAIGDLLLVGGGGWSSYLTSVEQYDTSQGTGGSWSAFEASLVQGRRTMACASDPVHGRLFVGNGWAGAFLAEAEQLDFQVLVEITFDVTVTGHCGDVIFNHGVLRQGAVDVGFGAVTHVTGEADMTVNPAVLETALCPDATQELILTLCNQGDCPLSALVYELGPTAALAGSMPFVPVSVGAESILHPTGPAPQGLSLSSPAPKTLGRPEAPADPEAVLWDQPLSTVNQAAYVSQVFPDYPSYSSFLADDFVNTGRWQITSIFVPGDLWNGATDLHLADALTWQIYASSATTPSIPAGDPSGGGSPPVWTLTLPPNAPRVTITSGTPGGLPSNVTLNLATPIILPPGHWWLVFYPTADFGAFGQYGRQPADTTNGYTGQFINPGGGFGLGTAWQNWTVLGLAEQDIAFRLEGNALPPVVDIPWLSGLPASRTVPRGQCRQVPLTFDASGLAPGDYSGDLMIVSNDPDTLTTTVTANLTVLQPVQGAAIHWSPTTPTVGETVHFTATVAGGSLPLVRSWDFGDGGTGSGRYVSHAYTAAGDYDVELTVDNACGQSVALETVTVEARLYLPLVIKR